MNVLVTQQFNNAMQKLDKQMQKEVSAFYSYLDQADKAHVLSSSLTRVSSQVSDLYTLRGKSVRIFCTLTVQNDIEYLVLVDVQKAQTIEFPQERETTLFGQKGEPIAYIENDNEMTIYTFNGEPVAYIDSNKNIYGFNGRHLGWFEDQIIWDHNGRKVGFTKTTCPTYPQYEPYKGYKQFKPFKAFKSFAPYKPFKTISYSDIDLLIFLKEGRV